MDVPRHDLSWSRQGCLVHNLTRPRETWALEMLSAFYFTKTFKLLKNLGSKDVLR